MEKDYWKAVATLVGIIIGAGVLGIPYVVAQSGWILGTIIMVVVGVSFIFLNLYMGEIVLRTKEIHQLSGYIERYLGQYGKLAMAFSMVVGIYGALIAYLIGEGQTLAALLPFNISPMIYTLLFFVITALIVWRGVKSAGTAELVFILAMLFVIGVIIAVTLPGMNVSYIMQFNMDNVLMPLGVIIFAFISSAAVPEMHELLIKKRKLYKKALITGSIIPIILYTMFSASVIGVVGLENFEAMSPNDRIATIALAQHSYPFLGVLANVFAVLAMFTSYIGLAVGLVEMYEYDFKWKRHNALIATLGLPLLFVMLDLSTFITVLAVTGGIAGGIDGILIVLAYWKARLGGDRRPEFKVKAPLWISYVVLALFMFALLQQVALLII